MCPVTLSMVSGSYGETNTDAEAQRDENESLQPLDCRPGASSMAFDNGAGLESVHRTAVGALALAMLLQWQVDARMRGPDRHRRIGAVCR